VVVVDPGRPGVLSLKANFVNRERGAASTLRSRAGILVYSEEEGDRALVIYWDWSLRLCVCAGS